MNNTIFVNIASYRDPLLPYTVDLLFKYAKYPENIRLGICWQYGDEDATELNVPKNQIKVLRVPAKQSKGACWARSLAFELYDGEDFFWLIDSHICPAYHWDEKLIQQFHQTEDPKALLSCAASQWNPPVVCTDWGNDPTKMAVSRATDFYGSILLQMFDIRDVREKPELNSFLTACNLFGPGFWINEVPYDPDFFFLGEEISLAVRSFTFGYNHYGTTETMAYHKHDRGYRRVYSDDNYREIGGLMDISLKRLDSQLQGTNEIPLGLYGLGKTRTVEQYEKYAGVNFKEKYISERAKTGRPDLNYL